MTAVISPSETHAPIQAIFSSIQGEGPYVGCRQLFVRFAHCHLKCRYCDTAMTSPSGQCHWERVAGSGEEMLLENPVSSRVLQEALRAQWSTANHHSVSLTGGEPLLYHRFLAAALPDLVSSGLRFYLETSGTQPAFLEPLLPWLSVIAMDIKLPSATGEPPEFEHQAAFYDLCLSSSKPRETFIKLIFEHTIPPEELAAIREIVRDPETPIYLQPVSLAPKVPELSGEPLKLACTPAELFRLVDTLQRHYTTVRVVPQTHKLLNIL